VKPLTFNQKRVVAGIYLALLLVAAGNEFLEWGLFGDSAKAVRAVVVLVGILAMVRFMPGFQREMEERNEVLRKEEMEAERLRDKTSDEAEAERVRRAIGMPPNKSLERTRVE
jgi:uncharacterized membrane protein YuzA (DUF378 family)